MLSITRRDIEEAKNYARDVMRTGRDYEGGGLSSGSPIVQTVEVGIGAVGVGYLTGRYGALHVGGNPVPLDLAAGLGVHLLTFLGKSMGFVSEGVAGHVHNVADGVLAGYLTKFGVGLGTSQRAKAGAAPLNLSSISGEEKGHPMGGHNGRPAPALANARFRPDMSRNKGPLTFEEVQAMAQAVR